MDIFEASIIKKNRLNPTQIVIERDPKRFFEIENPKHY